MVKLQKSTACALLLCLLVPNLSRAQNGKAYTLEACIDIALKNNSEFKNAVYRVNSAGATVKGSYSRILPQITSTFQSGRTIRGTTVNTQNIPVTDIITVVDTDGGERTFGATRIDAATKQPVVDFVEIVSPTSFRWGHQVTLRYNQTLYDFGRSWNAIRQAKASYEASSQSLTSARQNVFATVKQRYLELLKAQRLEQEFMEAVERSKEELNRTQSMYEIGSVAQIDVYRQEVTLGTDEINLINQQNTVKIAQGNLNVAMGRDPEEPLQVLEIEPNFAPPSFSLTEAYKVAEANNPELIRFQYDMESAEYGRKVAKGNFWPSIGISATYSRDNQNLDRVYGSLGENYALTLGASVSFNIFNGFSDVAELGRESANYSIAQENWIDQKRRLQLQVKQAYLNLEGFSRIAKINETRLRSAEEEYRLAQERYRVGAGTQLEVTEAQVSLTRARVQLVSSKYDALIAQAQLEAAMGTIDKDKGN
ncbi:MAG: TolC family protein [bacterium]